jgi:hypothetical protein
MGKGEVPVVAVELAPSRPPISNGGMANRIHLLVAFDVGYEVREETAREVARRLTPAESHERRLPRRYLEYQAPPVEVSLPMRELEIDQARLPTEVAARLFDFGGLVLSFRMPMPAARDQRLQLSRSLRFKPPVEMARQIAADVMEKFRAAIVRPDLDDLVESYVVLELDAEGDGAESLLARQGPYVAELLRGEGGALSGQEAEDALRSSVSFTPTDLVIADYDAAILFGLEHPDHEDVLDILEFTNLQLLELRALDRRLDRRISDLYGTAAAGSARTLFESGSRRQRLLRALTELKLDSALLAERLQNAFKVIGDLYYARIYRAAAQRLHLADWEASSERKLRVVGEIQDATLHALEARRFEVLEWIIIVLIAAELALGLLHR